MASNPMGAKRAPCARTQRHLQRAILGFFALAIGLFLVIYLAAPAIYVEALQMRVTAREAHPLAATLFLVALLLFVGTLSVGVVRRWRWLFWLLLVAFLASALQVPAGILELTGAIAVQQPAWYTILRMAIALVEVALGIWMLRAWRACGVWTRTC